jgi:hypothetical protein
MHRRRLVVGASAAGLVIGGLGALGNSAGQPSPQPVPGVTYGGVKALDPVWLRLDRSRSVIAAVEIPWAVAKERCSNRMGYFGILYAGYENFHPIEVSRGGKFSKRVVDRYERRGTRYEETQTVTGTITDERASGKIRGRVKYVRPNGKTIRCSFGPHTWNVVN